MINDLYEKEAFMYESKILKINIGQLGKNNRFDSSSFLLG